jgi:DNA-binding MarR family transcriptional regulator
VRPINSDDPATRSMLVDLFSDVSVLEQLVREWLKPLTGSTGTDRFNVLNHLIRLPDDGAKDGETLATLAWSFQVDLPTMTQTVEVMASRHLIEVDWVAGERCVFLTDAGRAHHADVIEAAAPMVAEILSELDPSALKITAETLREIRRTFDNLPGR